MMIPGMTTSCREPKRLAAAVCAAALAAVLWPPAAGRLLFAGDAPASRTPLVAPTPVASSDDDAQDLVFFSPKQPIIVRLHIRIDGASLLQLRRPIAEKILAALDADKNGVLEGKEIERIPPPDVLAAARQPNASPISSSAKADSHPADGRVTVDELRTYIMANAGAPFTLNVSSPATNQVVFFGDGRQQVNDLDVGLLLAVVDADVDGRLTPDEFSRIDDLVRFLDANDDETISRTEIAASRNVDASQPSTSNPLTGLATLLQPVDRWGSKAALVRKLIQLYDRTTRDPKTRRAGKDRKLSPAEISIDAAALARFDTDGDGLLDVNETALWLANPIPHVELDVHIGKNPSKKPRVALRKPTAPVGDVGLSIQTETGGKVLLTAERVPVELKAAESIVRPPRNVESYKQAFKRADRDGNKYLEVSELPYTGLQFGATEFAAIDRDHNGMVFENEWLAYFELRDALGDYRVTMSVAATSTDPVTQFDANSDGRLSRTEFIKALAGIKEWDKDADNRIAQDEIPRNYFGTFSVGGQNGDGRVIRSVVSGVGGQVAAALKSTSPVWFQKMDRNRDGEVSFREFLGPLAVFRRLDSDKNGFLSVVEAVAAKK